MATMTPPLSQVGPARREQISAQAQTLPAALREFLENPETKDAINVAEAALLYQTVRALRPTHSAEIGFRDGGSCLAILHALHENGMGVHHVCDPFQASYAKGAGLRNVAQSGLDGRFRFTEDFPERMFVDLPRIQFAFIDASHLFDHTMFDFVLVDRKLEVGGVVGFHDLWMPSLRRVVRYILTNRQYEPYLPSTEPVAFSRRVVPALLKAIPKADRIFSPDLLAPWPSFKAPGNLVLLRKLADDRRDYQHHVTF